VPPPVDQTNMDHAGLDAVLAAAMSRYTDAHITAIGPTGLFVPMPPLLELGARHQPIVGSRWAVDLVVAEEIGLVAAAWGRVKADGVANCDVHLAAEPKQVARLHFIDATHSYGVVIGMITGTTGSITGGERAQAQVKPRLVTVRKDSAAVVIDADPAIELVLGWTAGELTGRRALELVHPDDHQRAIASWIDLLGAPPGAARRVRLRHLHRDGSTIWFELTNHSRLDDPHLPHVVAEMLDISDEMAAQEALRANERMLARLTETLPLGVLQIGTDRKVVYQNSRVARATGGQIGEEMEMDGITAGDRPAAIAAIDAVLRGEDEIELEYGYRSRFAGARRIHATLRPLTDDDGGVTGAIICLADITDASRLREELRHRATYDELTGCLNRASTLAALHEALSSSSGRGTAVMFLDLNNFKVVNDRFGHAVGDRLLTLVSNHLRTSVRGNDAIGRFGGDEFVVVCRDVADPDRARRIAEAVVAALNAATLEVDGDEIHPQASIGVAWAAPGTAAAESLIARADAAMYEAKRTRTGRMALVLAS
jgi:diguanylate cyclase (GGDEF)-like protein/PAS domain S-box-containing protein